MLNKEEIEKAKAFMVFYKNYCLNIETANMENYETVDDEEFVYKNIKTILQYTAELETREQKLIDKLEQDVEELEILNDNYIDANVLEGTYETLGRISEAKKILSIIKLQSNKETQ